MPRGSCVCGDWTYEYEGEPAGITVCHCLPCRKTAGANGSYQHLVPNDKFKKLSGQDLLFDRPGDSGKLVHYRNCAKCATVMCADADAMEGLVIVKAGTIDEQPEQAVTKPGVEMYRKNAPEWCTPIEGIEQKQAA